MRLSKKKMKTNLHKIKSDKWKVYMNLNNQNLRMY